ncbi:MAG TPA: hypothetical protein VN442_09565 [Bryobacteraceae bacterium]|nr:hypothetical protein [Bryobacteraceae bacterium]
MTCRRCKAAYDAQRNKSCPQCGEPQPRPRPAFLKTSTILISTGARRHMYRSLEDVPPPLRSKLLQSTNGSNSATILIADRRGREEIARAVRRLPGKLRAAAQDTGAPVPSPRAAMRRTAGIILALLSALSMWAVLGWPWK